MGLAKAKVVDFSLEPFNEKLLSRLGLGSPSSPATEKVGADGRVLLHAPRLLFL